MASTSAICKKRYIEVPPPRSLTAAEIIARLVAGTVMSPYYFLRARFAGLPGLMFARESALVGVRALLHKKSVGLSWEQLYKMIFWPIESVRYFEFDAVWRFLAGQEIRTYLDVSSPRLFPIAIARHHHRLEAEVINPDNNDLKPTRALMRACGLQERCRTSSLLIEDVPFAPASFDAITSISVLEHIRESGPAFRKVWDLLKPGGRLVISVPCAAAAAEDYLNVDHFGLQTADEKGFYFLQYVYDEALLEERFFSVFGQPAKLEVYGERDPGSLMRGLVQKWATDKYPYWREPYIMARGFQRYKAIADLPGDGVVVMQFVKP